MTKAKKYGFLASAVQTIFFKNLVNILPKFTFGSFLKSPKMPSTLMIRDVINGQLLAAERENLLKDN